ncbi:MAG: glycosyltransferase family 2 protein [Shimia sp.]
MIAGAGERDAGAADGRGTTGLPPPAISVLVINWNGVEDTMISVASVAAQDTDDWELVVVDNGSTDDSVAVLGPRLAALPRTRLVESAENGGFSGGVNAGLAVIDRAPGRFVLLLNNDAALAPDALRRMLAAARADPGLGIVGGTILNRDDDGVQFVGGGHVDWTTGRTRRRGPGAPDFISGALALIRTEVLVALGGFSRDYFMYWEDVDFSLRAVAAGWRLGLAPDAVARHAAMGSTGTDSPVYDHHFTRGAARFFWHGAGRAARGRRALPIAIVTGRKLAKRVLRGPRGNLHAIWSGLRDGLRAPGRDARHG